MKYKRRSTGEEKVQKIAAGEEGNYRMERVPLKQTDRHDIPGRGLVYKRQVTGVVNKTANVAAHAVVNAALAVVQGNNARAVPQVLPLETWWG